MHMDTYTYTYSTHIYIVLIEKKISLVSFEFPFLSFLLSPFFLAFIFVLFYFTLFPTFFLVFNCFSPLIYFSFQSIVFSFFSLSFLFFILFLYLLFPSSLPFLLLPCLSFSLFFPQQKIPLYSNESQI